MQTQRWSPSHAKVRELILGLIVRLSVQQRRLIKRTSVSRSWIEKWEAGRRFVFRPLKFSFFLFLSLARYLHSGNIRLQKLDLPLNHSPFSPSLHPSISSSFIQMPCCWWIQSKAHLSLARKHTLRVGASCALTRCKNSPWVLCVCLGVLRKPLSRTRKVEI